MSKNRDKIEICDLQLRCIIGIQDWERKTRQDVLINVTLFTDLSVAGKSDRIEDTINYKNLSKQIITLTEGSAFYLVEMLAEEIAGLALADKRVESVCVRVEKPGALRFSRSVGVTIERDQAA
ncbi:MAG: dihydroneopterin aldolase [Magnetococcales bacterium]|nr:dihydroneopterin aldolase [Magnetococcales bacterium]